MGKKNRKKSNETVSSKPSPVQKKNLPVKGQGLIWILLLLGITAICFFPMLSNGFTNWDDEFYVTNNLLLRGPDWQGIFSEPVVGNYHPLTIASLALNYALSGTDPSSYLLFNYLLHLINTVLVFYFIMDISGKKTDVAFFTALIFGIHPLHVESVAWISERKDVLYTVFFLLSLRQYWSYLQTGQKRKLFICFFLFVLSLLAKPAAVILPLALLALDYWQGRKFTVNVFLEKIPFFILSVLFGIITIKIQSPTAIAGLEVYPLWSRLFFACYVIMIYFTRLIVPYPLSAFHPFPAADDLGLPVLLSPLFIVALLAFLWYQRKNKLVLFGFAFYIINLLLVLQVISIGLTIVSERYTYVPYIGLAFIAGMYLHQKKAAMFKQAALLIPLVIAVVFGAITYQYTSVWKNSDTLWSNVIEHYPNTPYPRTNRANYLSKMALDPAFKNEAASLYEKAITDCNIALQLKPNLAAGYEKRGLIYLDLQRNEEALKDADSFIKLEPGNRLGYDMRGTAYLRLKDHVKALADYDKCISLKPDDHRSYNNRATIYHTYFQKYTEAIQEYTKAINISPEGYYYLNRSYSYYQLGDIAKAREDVQIALQKGTVVADTYKTTLQLK